MCVGVWRLNIYSRDWLHLEILFSSFYSRSICSRHGFQSFSEFFSAHPFDAEVYMFPYFHTFELGGFLSFLTMVIYSLFKTTLTRAYIYANIFAWQKDFFFLCVIIFLRLTQGICKIGDNMYYVYEINWRFFESNEMRASNFSFCSINWRAPGCAVKWSRIKVWFALWINCSNLNFHNIYCAVYKVISNFLLIGKKFSRTTIL